jgi:putative ABC transport system permease protein
MLINFLTITYRNLLKNKVFSFVNVFGLAAGMTAFILIISYVRFERSYENFHENADNIFRITLDLYNGSEYVVTDCETYQTIGPKLKDELPEVLDYVRMFHNDGLQDIAAGDNRFLDEGIYFADPSVFNIFSLDVIHGDHRKALKDPYQAVLSTSTARKYFGRTDVVGKLLKIDNREYAVTTVIKDLPRNTHLKFNALLSHATLEQIYPGYKKNEWNGNNEYTYLLMAPGTDLAGFNKKLVDISASLKEKIGSERFQAERVKDIHLYSTKSFEPEPPGSAKVVYSMLLIAVFIITLAWVNYVNLSTARAVDRGREVGIRKVMGSLRVQLVLQFLCESVIVNLLAGGLAFIFFYAASPLFQTLTGQPLPADPLSDLPLWLLFLSLLVAGSLLAGVYPAMLLSSFQAASVLKGKFRSSAYGQRLRKILVTFQFGATVVLVAGLLAVYLQVNYLRNYDLGMNIHQTLVLRAPHFEQSDSTSRAKFLTLKNELLRQADVKRVASSESVPGLSIHELNTTSWVTRIGADKPQGSYNYYCVGIDGDFLPALDIQLVAGRNFDNGGPNVQKVIINEEAVERLGFGSAGEAVGSKISYLGGSTIIGVVKNFHQRSPKEPHFPMIFSSTQGPSYFSLALETNDMPRALSEVKAVWDRVFPNSVFHYFFLDETYARQYEADIRLSNLMAMFSGLAVLIACLGLFGLSSFTIVQRTKEIGIRKVLGASIAQIVSLLSLDFIKVVLIAALLALPIAYLVVQEWLSHYAVRIGLNLWMFVVPILMMLLLALVTVGLQTTKTALSNPTDSLRQE